MRPPAMLGAYAVVLAVVFAIGLALGHLAGPSAGSPSVTHTDHPTQDQR